MRARPFLIAMTALALLAPAAAAQPVRPDLAEGSFGWISHADAATGMRLDYPADIFRIEDGGTDIGTGKKLRSADGRAELAFYALPNRENETPRSYLAKKLLLERSQIIYQRVSEQFFVISSIRNDRIFYSRCNFGRSMHCFYLEYPQNEKRAWDPIVTRMSRSLS